jgi:steroid 5-alpha reductase family enzyme
MLFFLLKVTGVPATEQRAALSRPDYEEYRRSTSAFVPWFTRRS